LHRSLRRVRGPSNRGRAGDSQHQEAEGLGYPLPPPAARGLVGDRRPGTPPAARGLLRARPADGRWACVNEVEQRLREIEERVSKATPGPWRAVCEATAEETACGRDVYSLTGPEWV